MLVAELIQTILQQRGPKLRAALEEALRHLEPDNAADLGDAAASTLRSGSAEPMHVDALTALLSSALHHAPDAVRQSLDDALDNVAPESVDAAIALRRALPP
jgi:hypothetical protein